MFVQYILGDLSESATQQIEERYFAESEFLLKLRCVSDELLVAYLQNKLPLAQKSKLEPRCHPFVNQKNSEG